VTCAPRVGALITTVAIRVPRLIVDLAGLECTDCAGMRALAAAARHARQAGGGLVLAGPGPLVLRVLDLTGLMAGVRVYPSVEEAAGVASPERDARPVPEPGAQALAAGLPTVRPGRQQEEGQRDPHQQPSAADTRPHSR
jgi:anti-anti-sigma factor